ncbi:MAG TPA: hypothetical protein VF541_18235 [Longimicrobium sp.]
MAIISSPNKTARIRRVANLSAADEKAILDFLQGAVRVRWKDHPNDWFGLRDLMGGENGDWRDTPMQRLFDRHYSVGVSETEAKRKAGIEGGHLLKRVLHEDRRRYDSARHYRTAVYKPVP